MLATLVSICNYENNVLIKFYLSLKKSSAFDIDFAGNAASGMISAAPTSITVSASIPFCLKATDAAYRGYPELYASTLRVKYIT